MRKNVFELLTKHPNYGMLTGATPSKLLENEEFRQDTELDIKSLFGSFASYFKGFQENRKNMYTSKAISTSVPYRIVHDNFPKFMADIEVYNNIKELCPDILRDAEDELQSILDGKNLDDVFSLEFYNSLLNQEGIDFFNQIIGGVTIGETEEKLKGINEFANLYRQQHQELKTKKKSLTMIPLFKQILSDRETYSFIPQSITYDEELLNVIKHFHESMTCADIDGERINIVKELCDLLVSARNYDSQHVFINSKSITDVSQSVCKNWNHISDCLKKQAIHIYGSGTKTAVKNIDYYLKRDAYSFHDLECVEIDLYTYYNDCADLSESIAEKYKQFCEHAMSAKKGCITSDPIIVENIKDLLDAYMQLLNKAESLKVSEEYDLDKMFYNRFFVFYDAARLIIPLYTKVRNYITRKPYKEEKIKLTFDVPTLADGWDKNQEQANKAVLLFRNGKSFLAITAASKNNKVNWDNMSASCGDGYSKLVYKLLPCPNNMLPKVFFSEKGIKTFTPPQHIIDGYHNKRFKNDKKFLHELIDFYKDAISRHPDWNKFQFVFSPTDSFDDIGSFYNEISTQSYRISYQSISESEVEKLIDEGKLYLFQIYNKDYAAGAHGSKNLHTLYWENLFSEENLRDLVLKLNGEAELFYRDGSINNPVIHKVGEKILNKRDKFGMPVSEEVYIELYRYYNSMLSESELSDEAKEAKANIIVKDVTHEIIKDRRYTKPHFQFHVPLTINFRAQGKDSINDQVNEYLSRNPDVNIIGLDRGERHLIYLTLINQKGEILRQKTFNVVNNMNYQVKLTQHEKERDVARKSWKTVGKIKELKEGFLSAVVHEITAMMVEYNAIVVMEDLNWGFKRGRFKVERQVYQKFEKMLIDKLNYLPLKNRRVDESGGILRGYQFAEKFESFQKMGKQSGFLFYIPAAYTSKIDPVSGFVNIFDFNGITNAETRKDFFGKFDSIKFVSAEEGFEFTFNYANFETYQTDYQRQWTVSTRGKRIVMKVDKGYKHMEDYYPTDELIKEFKEIGYTPVPGMDMKAVIDSIKAGNKSASFFSNIFYAFQKTLQMRNSNSSTEEDFIQSPVKVNGRYFNSDEEAKKGHDASGNWKSTLPVDADANGAYHIALKGLYMLMYPGNKIEHARWLEFMQTKPYK